MSLQPVKLSTRLFLLTAVCAAGLSAAGIQLSFTWKLFAPQPEPPLVANIGANHVQWASTETESRNEVEFIPASGSGSFLAGDYATIGIVRFKSGRNEMDPFNLLIPVDFGIMVASPFVGDGVLNPNLRSTRIYSGQNIDSLAFDNGPLTPTPNVGSAPIPLTFLFEFADFQGGGQLIDGQLLVDIGSEATASVRMKILMDDAETQVPEPSTWAAAGLGLLSMLALRRRVGR